MIETVRTREDRLVLDVNTGGPDVTASQQTAAARQIAELHPPHATLAAALVAALGEMPTIPKTRTADAGSYSYDYADLEGVRAIVVPILARHGLAVRTPVHEHGEGLAVTVKFLHTSGETLDDDPLPFERGRDAQATGSAISYFRALRPRCVSESGDGGRRRRRHRPTGSEEGAADGRPQVLRQGGPVEAVRRGQGEGEGGVGGDQR